MGLLSPRNITPASRKNKRNSVSTMNADNRSFDLLGGGRYGVHKKQRTKADDKPGRPVSLIDVQFRRE